MVNKAKDISYFTYTVYFQRINLKATKHEIIHDC